MNQYEALELATEHGIVVSTDRYERKNLHNQHVYFTVGELVCRKPVATMIWWTVAENGQVICYPNSRRTMYFRRGEAMEFCINRILGARQLAGVTP